MLKGTRGYKDINLLAFKLLNPGNSLHLLLLRTGDSGSVSKDRGRCSPRCGPGCSNPADSHTKPGPPYISQLPRRRLSQGAGL
jgi:hypothetical protein